MKYKYIKNDSVRFRFAHLILDMTFKLNSYIWNKLNYRYFCEIVHKNHLDKANNRI